MTEKAAIETLCKSLDFSNDSNVNIKDLTIIMFVTFDKLFYLHGIDEVEARIDEKENSQLLMKDDSRDVTLKKEKIRSLVLRDKQFFTITWVTRILIHVLLHRFFFQTLPKVSLLSDTPEGVRLLRWDDARKRRRDTDNTWKQSAEGCQSSISSETYFLTRCLQHFQTQGWTSTRLS